MKPSIINCSIFTNNSVATKIDKVVNVANKLSNLQKTAMNFRKIFPHDINGVLLKLAD